MYKLEILAILYAIELVAAFSAHRQRAAVLIEADESNVAALDDWCSWHTHRCFDCLAVSCFEALVYSVFSWKGVFSSACQVMCACVRAP